MKAHYSRSLHLRLSNTFLIMLWLSTNVLVIISDYIISRDRVAQIASSIYTDTIEKDGRIDRGVILRSSLSPKCDGRFDFPVGENYRFQVLEATYDSTPLVKERFRRQHPDKPIFRHILVQFDVNEQVQPVVGTSKRVGGITNKRNITALIHPPQKTIHIEVDHLRKIQCASPIHGQYTNQIICEWSMSLTLWPDVPSSELEFSRLLDQLQKSETSAVHIDIPLQIQKTKEKPGSSKSKWIQAGTIHPKIGLACVDTFTIQPELDWLSKPGTSKCKDSNQSLMVLGSPVSGPASMDDGAIEAAHFAFRALTGKVLFSSVYVAFTTRMTRSRMAYECHNVTSCIHRHILNNAHVMQNYKELMEGEFDNLGLSEPLRRRIVITEFCRLGGKGPLDGCKRIRGSGQVLWGEFAMAQMAHGHKWIGSMDLDEFIGNDPAVPGQNFRPSVDAVKFF